MIMGLSAFSQERKKAKSQNKQIKAQEQIHVNLRGGITARRHHFTRARTELLL
jgi:hypothetical protein